jgi:hypothetical protein
MSKKLSHLEGIQKLNKTQQKTITAGIGPVPPGQCACWLSIYPSSTLHCYVGGPIPRGATVLCLL